MEDGTGLSAGSLLVREFISFNHLVSLLSLPVLSLPCPCPVVVFSCPVVPLELRATSSLLRLRLLPPIPSITLSTIFQTRSIPTHILENTASRTCRIENEVQGAMAWQDPFQMTEDMQRFECFENQMCGLHQACELRP